MTMSKWQRIEATIRGEAVDRTPLSMWVHYHLQDRGPQGWRRALIASTASSIWIC